MLFLVDRDVLCVFCFVFRIVTCSIAYTTIQEHLLILSVLHESVKVYNKQVVSSGLRFPPPIKLTATRYRGHSMFFFYISPYILWSCFFNPQRGMARFPSRNTLYSGNPRHVVDCRGNPSRKTRRHFTVWYKAHAYFV